jgi:hypothetical protein
VRQHASFHIASARTALVGAQDDRRALVATVNSARKVVGLPPVGPRAPIGHDWLGHSDAAAAWDHFEQELFLVPRMLSNTFHDYERTEGKAQRKLVQVEKRIAAHKATIARFLALRLRYADVTARLMQVCIARGRPGRPRLAPEHPAFEMSSLTVLMDAGIMRREYQLRTLFLRAHLGDDGDDGESAREYLLELEYVDLVCEARSILATVKYDTS